MKGLLPAVGHESAVQAFAGEQRLPADGYRDCGDLLRHWAAVKPNAEAYAFLVDGETERVSLSYRQLLEQAERVAASFAVLTMPGDRVVLLMPSGVDYLVGLFACLLSGRIAVPSAPPRPNRRNDRLRHMLTDCRARVILTSRAAKDLVDGVLGASSSTSPIAVLVCEEIAERASVDAAFLATMETDPLGSPERVTTPASFDHSSVAWLQYTSGSTGSPRGVIVTHANVLANVLALGRASGTQADSRFLSWLPLFHDMGLIAGVMQPMYWGVPATLMSPQHFLQQPMRWLRAISRERATKSGAPNFAYQLCLGAAATEALGGLDLSSWRVAWNGAEPILPATLRAFTATFSQVGFDDRAHFLCYGLAEATLFVSCSAYRAGANVVPISRDALQKGHVSAPSSNDDCRLVVTCGLPMGGNVCIVDPEHGMPCSPGEIGEIWIRGDGVAAGYWGRPEESEHTFCATLSNAPGLQHLRTGDLGALVNGELIVTGRLKDLLIIRGRNLYPQDIEAALERVVPFISTNGCAVVATEVDGAEAVAVVIEADRRFVRTLAAADGTSDAGEALAAQREVEATVRQIIAAVAEEAECAVAQIAFMKPGAFPKTSSGKVQRSACRQGLADGTLAVAYLWQAGRVPIADQPTSNNLSDPDVTPSAALISRIVMDHLRSEGLPAHAFSVDATFSDLGIDSFAALGLLHAVEDGVGCFLTPQALYDCPTIRTLAAYIDSPAVARRLPGPRATEARSASHLEAASPVTDLTAQPRVASQDALHARYAHRNAKFVRLREAGHYHYGIPLTEQGDSWGTQNGRRMLMLGSYSYLGLIGHPHISAASTRTIAAMGTGHHGVRVLAGTTSQHRALEQRLAKILGGDDAIVMSSGFGTNVATIAALVGEGDYVVGDEWNHASIADGCRFSGAEFQMYAHNDMQALEDRLCQSRGRHTLVVVDAVFSMDGDIVDLPRVVELCRTYGALLMVDEAHSFGVLGRRGHGIQEHFGLPSDAVDVKMATLSKAIPSAGGVVCGRQSLVDYLRHHARGYIFSGALPAPCVAAASAALDVMESEPERLVQLWRNVGRYTTGLRSLGFNIGLSKTPVVPILCPDERIAMEMTRLCREDNVFVVPVIYPAVPMNAPRLRTCMLSSFTDEDIDVALDVLSRAARGVGLI